MIERRRSGPVDILGLSCNCFFQENGSEEFVLKSRAAVDLDEVRELSSEIFRVDYTTEDALETTDEIHEFPTVSLWKAGLRHLLMTDLGKFSLRGVLVQYPEVNVG